MYEFNLNMTRRFNWNEPFFLIMDTIGGPFNDGWFYCYQFYDDFKLVYTTKFENFVDFGDLYLSFIFNLLGNSLQIKQQSERMVEASARHDSVKYFTALGTLMRLMLDFNSYKTAGQSVFAYAANSAQDYSTSGFADVPSKNTRLRMQQIRSENQRRDVPKLLNEDVHRRPARLRSGEGYSWGLWDIVQAPFALSTGSLHALPRASYGFECSTYLQSSRQYLMEARGYFGDAESLDGYNAMHNSLSFTGNIGVLCYYAFAEDLSKSHFESQIKDPIEILINVGYNLGSIWVDVQNFLFYTPATVPQGDWGYFVLYLLGDAAMSFWYRDTSLGT